MNLRNVLKTYSLLRALSDDEAALLTTLRSMNDTERELLVESLGPVKAAGKKTKVVQQRTIEHCAACDYTRRAAVHKDTSLSDYHEFQAPSSSSVKPKSARAEKLAEQIKGTGKPPRLVESLCTACDYDSDHNIHHLESTVGYHPFESLSTAPGATEQSSASNGAGSTIRNSVDETVSAQGVVGGSSE